MTERATADRVLIAGGTGATGTELLSVLRPTDFTVRATTRSYASVDDLDRLGADETVVADCFDPSDAVAAVRGCDIVYCTLGSSPSYRQTIGGKLVDRTGVYTLLTAAVSEGVSHFVYTSAIGVGDSKAGLGLPKRLLRRGVLRAKADAETAIRRSTVDYTIVRPGTLTNDPPSGHLLVGDGGDSVTGSISRTDLARLLAAAPFTPEARNRTVEVVSRAGLDGEPTNLADIDWAFDRVLADHDRMRL